MFISVFDVFKIGLGPSSSHTVGPMVAAARFLSAIDPLPAAAARVQVRLHGSLAFTGKGHATDRAICLGLMGQVPSRLDPEEVEPMLERLARDKEIKALDGTMLAFDPDADLIFDFGPALPLHSNGMVFSLLDSAGAVLTDLTLYSIGGGFIASAEEISQSRSGGNDLAQQDVPYPFPNAATMLEMGRASGLTIAQMKWANECAARPADEVQADLDRIWAAMNACIDRGLKQDGILPGRLKVKRRARAIHEKLLADHGTNSPFKHTIMDWLGVYAMAVNEENAAGGRVVTAPTNGAAGVIPAVVRYYLDHCPNPDQAGIRTFLLTAAAIGGIIKANASISGAEVGCQGEVGSASAMAAAGLCAALGGTNEQIENAAEIALEHHLGMTCDPIGGLVQVPCIERNAVGAVKAVTAASLALRGDGTHFVPLDGCIETMRQTGLDMTEKYKETSTGGLAVNIVEC